MWLKLSSVAFRFKVCVLVLMHRPRAQLLHGTPLFLVKLYFTQSHVLSPWMIWLIKWWFFSVSSHEYFNRTVAAFVLNFRIQHKWSCFTQPWRQTQITKWWKKKKIRQNVKNMCLLLNIFPFFRHSEPCLPAFSHSAPMPYFVGVHLSLLEVRSILSWQISV